MKVFNKIIKKYKPNYVFGPKNYFKRSPGSSSVILGKDYNLVKTSYTREISSILKN